MQNLDYRPITQAITDENAKLLTADTSPDNPWRTLLEPRSTQNSEPDE
ncbi:hypothetical protein [Microbacterium lacus]